VNTDLAYGRVRKEIERALIEHGVLKVRTPLRCFAILTREVGEVADAVLLRGKAAEIGPAGYPTPNQSLRSTIDREAVMSELAQVAATAIIWIQLMEEDPTV
jgi:NTP pyrophosphatase (non-canonical NTP hydrolase)